MGMYPSATLTYGYDIQQHDDWDEDEPAETAGRLLHEAGFPTEFGVHHDYGDSGTGGLRLYATYLGASGWRDKGETESLALPDDVDEQLRRAAEVLGVDLGDAKPGWTLVARFD